MAPELQQCISERGQLLVNKFGQLVDNIKSPIWLSQSKIFSFGDICKLSHVNNDVNSIVTMYQYVKAISANVQHSLLGKGAPTAITNEIAFL